MIAIELQLLVWAALLGVLQLFLTAGTRTQVYGPAWNAGARDTDPDTPLPPLVGRFERAQRNFLETFPMFAAVVLAAAIAGRLSDNTALGAWMYLGGRLAYVPLYALGVPFVRSVAWGIATIGILIIAWAVIS